MEQMPIPWDAVPPAKGMHLCVLALSETPCVARFRSREISGKGDRARKWTSSGW